jgi:16S rRNA (uracil1498-N3)-methyltransferase
MVMKATELGVARIQPVLTARAQIREVNAGRCLSIAIEAAEQSERMTIPDIQAPLALDSLVKNWPRGRLPIVCAESGEATPIAKALQQPGIKAFSQAAVITGPEGGFAPEELERLRQLPHALPVRLGPRILRADTAALAALTCWQAYGGDWKDF